MNLLNIEVVAPEILKTPKNKRPIWFCNVNYSILLSKKRVAFKLKKIVLKGTIAEIIKDDYIQRRILIEHYGGGKAGYKKLEATIARGAALGFTLDYVHIIKSLGYGIKQN